MKLQRSPIQKKDLNLLTRARVEKLRKELQADSVIVIARSSGTIAFQESHSTSHDILFAAQYLLSELEGDLGQI